MCEVALKTLKADSSEEDKVKFLQEAAIMAQFKHPNVITLHGVVSDKVPVSETSISTNIIAPKETTVDTYNVNTIADAGCGDDA